jgi:hypothetical protein
MTSAARATTMFDMSCGGDNSNIAACATLNGKVRRRMTRWQEKNSPKRMQVDLQLRTGSASAMFKHPGVSAFAHAARADLYEIPDRLLRRQSRWMMRAGRWNAVQSRHRRVQWNAVESRHRFVQCSAVPPRRRFLTAAAVHVPGPPASHVGRRLSGNLKSRPDAEGVRDDPSIVRSHTRP